MQLPTFRKIALPPLKTPRDLARFRARNERKGEFSPPTRKTRETEAFPGAITKQCDVSEQRKTARSYERFSGGPTLKAMGSTPVHARFPPWLPVPG